MAKYPIPVHIAVSEKGADKIITSKKRVEELGANAFIVSKGSMKKLEAEGPTIDFEKLASAAATAVLLIPACSIPKNPLGVIKAALIEAAND